MFRNIEKRVLEFEYDAYYKALCEIIKEIPDNDIFLIERKKGRKKLEELLNINKNLIDIEKLKKNFANILLDENSSQILWLLNNIYIDEECTTSYLDTVSDVFKKSNEVVRKGVNTYKVNGWMTHTLYVYQIANKNIANNIVPTNFKNTEKFEFIKECFDRLHKEYIELDNTSKFILKITTLIHDIGVAESVKEHGFHGQKFVEQVLKDIGITDEFLKENNIGITLKNLQILEKAILKDHTIYTGVSSESSDYFVDMQYKEFLNKIDTTGIDRQKITTILYIFTVCDVIGVNEIIFDEQKIKVLDNARKFFCEIIDNKAHVRNKKQVALERICDLTGKFDLESVKQNSESAMKKFSINSDLFWNRLYYVGQFWFFLAIMKDIATNFDNVIRILDSIFDVTATKFGEDKIKFLSVTWFPNNHEKQAIKNLENESFFEAMNLLKHSLEDKVEYKKNRLAAYEKQGRIHFDIEIL